MNKQEFSNGETALVYAKYLVNQGYQVAGKGIPGHFVIYTNAPKSQRESALFVAYVR